MKIRDWVGTSAIVEFQLVRSVRMWHTFFDQFRVHPFGALLHDSTSVHVFLFMRRKGFDMIVNGVMMGHV